MAQHQQLKVPDLDAPATAKQQLQQRNERQVDERQDHRTILSAPATPELPGRSGFVTLQGHKGCEITIAASGSSRSSTESGPCLSEATNMLVSFDDLAQPELARHAAQQLPPA